MKLVMAIISNRDDAQAVLRELITHGFQATKLASTGGLLMSGHTTVLSGVDEEKVDEVIGLIKGASHSRQQTVPAMSDPGMGVYFSTIPLEVTVGGAVIFVLDVDRFERA